MARLNSPKKSSLPLSGRWPQRWKDRPHAARSSGSLEDRIGAALASVLHAEALPEPRLVAALARVARARKAAPSRVWRVRLAAFASVLLMGTGVVFAREGLLRTARRWMGVPAASQPVPTAAVKAPRMPSAKRSVTVATVQAPLPASVDVPAAAVVLPPAIPRAKRDLARAEPQTGSPIPDPVPTKNIETPPALEPPSPPVAVSLAEPSATVFGPRNQIDSATVRRDTDSPAPQTSGLVAETKHLRQAIRSLRVEGNPAATLATLDIYSRVYPQGELFYEAALLRVDAFLALHRKAEALATLMSLPLGQLPGGAARLLARAELRLATDPSGALADAQQALALASSAQINARARQLVERATQGNP